MNIKKIKSDLQFSLCVLVHPFDSFWGIKRENKGSKTVAVFINIALVIVLLMRRQLTGFLFNYNISSEMNTITQITGVLLPLMMWCLANWGISTLVDGEQTLSEIYISTLYSLTPLILFNLPMILISHIISMQEAPFYNILDTISIIWTILLIFISNMVINQFTIKKTIFTLMITLCGVVIIMFFILFFFAVAQQMLNFILLIFKELSMR